MPTPVKRFSRHLKYWPGLAWTLLLCSALSLAALVALQWLAPALPAAELVDQGLVFYDAQVRCSCDVSHVDSTERCMLGLRHGELFQRVHLIWTNQHFMTDLPHDMASGWEHQLLSVAFFIRQMH